MISVIDLSFNSLGEQGCTDLALALVTNPYVTELVSAHNRIRSHAH